MARKPKAATIEAFGILNPYGDLWTPKWFESHSEAKNYVRDFWFGTDASVDLSKYPVVPVRVRVSAIIAAQASPRSAPHRIVGVPPGE